MATQKERLQQYRETQDPMARITKVLNDSVMVNAISRLDMVKGEKGEDGYTPVKGKDYFTPAEIQSIISYIRMQVKDGQTGPKGDTGIAGKHGYTPTRGVDYWTAEDKQQILSDISKLLPKVEKAKPVDVQAIIAEVKKTPITYDEIKGAPKIKDLNELVQYLKIGGFRGGGGGGTASLTLTTIGTSGAATYSGGVLNIPVYTSSGSSVTFYDNEIVSGSGTTFTLAHALDAGSEHIYAGTGTGGRARLVSSVDYTMSGQTITIIAGSYAAGEIYADYRFGGSVPVESDLLLEDGTNLLLEDGTNLLLEN